MFAPTMKASAGMRFSSWSGLGALVVACAVTGCGSDDGGGGSGGAAGSATGGSGGAATGGSGGATTGGAGGAAGSATGGSGGAAGSATGGTGGSGGIGGGSGGIGGGSGGSGGGSGGSGGSSAAGTATVDWDVKIGSRTMKITKCSFADGTAKQLKIIQDSANSAYSAKMVCAVNEVGSFTAFFVVDVWFFASAVGKTDAAALTYACSASGCVGTGNVKLTYQDGAKGILETFDFFTADSKTGSLTVDTFTSATGAVKGSIDLTGTKGTVTASLKGTFDAKLFDCKKVQSCIGDGK